VYCSGCDYWWTDKHLEMVRAHRREPPAGSRVSLVLEPNGTDHRDLILRLGPFVHRSDSYYYALDHPVGVRASAAGSLRLLLAWWHHVVSQSSEGAEPFCLAHDFSDQCTGWIQGTVRGGEVRLIPGW